MLMFQSRQSAWNRGRGFCYSALLGVLSLSISRFNGEVKSSLTGNRQSLPLESLRFFLFFFFFLIPIKLHSSVKYLSR